MDLVVLHLYLKNRIRDVDFNWSVKSFEDSKKPIFNSNCPPFYYRVGENYKYQEEENSKQKRRPCLRCFPPEMRFYAKGKRYD